jgi:hypothetical protein
MPQIQHNMTRCRIGHLNEKPGQSCHTLKVTWNSVKMFLVNCQIRLSEHSKPIPINMERTHGKYTQHGNKT